MAQKTGYDALKRRAPGSVLTPLLFNIYTYDLPDTIPGNMPM